ncbi:MAG: VOC family protein [Planctomyces sp.]|nr:VOC family protein [Planctomyces sp.]
MKLEHVAINVPDPLSLSRWYVEHLGLKVVRRFMEPPYGHFLADDSGQVLLEIYGNEQAPRLEFSGQHPAMLHFAFVSRDVEADARRLVAAGAVQIGQFDRAANGDRLAMLRDPWGVCVQLVERAQPMLGV